MKVWGLRHGADICDCDQAIKACYSYATSQWITIQVRTALAAYIFSPPVARWPAPLSERPVRLAMLSRSVPRISLVR
jgi:hypothetical protein